jgi:hypothetical protein
MKPRAGSVCRALFNLAAALAIGCRTAAPLAPADFSAPGWRVQQGQAVWKPSSHRAELAGDLLVATNANGDFFVQFSKTPFPLATAQVSGGQWRVEFGSREYSRQGRGEPPDRFAWFQLPRALLGDGVHSPWKFALGTPGSWRLENPGSGEILEGGFFP